MGTRKFHLKRAKHHYAAYEHLANTDEFVDWAFVALFYSAHQYVHSVLSGEPVLLKDERHPRKHTSGPFAGNGGRGTNQLVAELYPSVNTPYRSLFELSHRTRYDILQLDDKITSLALTQFRSVKQFCEGVNKTRPDRWTDEP